MPKFYYVARDKNGDKRSGLEDGANQEEVISSLQSKDLLVVSITTDAKADLSALKGGTAVKAKLRRKHGGCNDEDKVLFCRQLGTLLGAGVTILKCLDIIKQQVSSRQLYEVLSDLQKKMEAGLSFHEAMSKHPKVFSELWVNLVESGEASGNLAVILNRLAGYLERSAAFKSKLVSALVYPVILFLAGFGALMFLSIWIIPTFAKVFEGLNIKLPIMTVMLIGFSGFLRSYFLVIAGIAVAGFFIFRKYISTRGGKRNFENFLFGLPLLGDFFRALVVERFTSEMSTLVESGVPILYSLEISEHSVGNIVLSEIIHKVKEAVREGKPLSQPMEKSGFFDPMVVQMVAIGEEIGELSNMFKRLNTFYQEHVDTFLVRFISMFEPVMLIFMGLVIGTIVIGMFLPIFQIATVGQN
ncbi:MAG: type II secretion system F family protein [Candidatus Omnitrophica bacterium]|nr:type II secretion system F family protein [Candidatus Omnitrophota bacterium]